VGSVGEATDNRATSDYTGSTREEEAMDEEVEAPVEEVDTAADAENEEEVSAAFPTATAVTCAKV